MKKIVPVLLMLASVTALPQTPHRIPIASISSSINTGMNYTPWLNDSLTSLVQSVWGSINNQYVDVTLSLPYRIQLSKLSFYDYTGVFTTNPAYIYALKDTQKIFLGLFQGLQYEVFVDLAAPDSILADAIIIRKYGNNIPQKVQIYGTGLPDSVVTGTTQTNAADSVVPIPIDPKRWYTLNNLSNGLGALFDSVTNISVNTGYSSFIPNYDSYYPVDPGENIVLKQIKLYDMYGTFANDPATISVIKSNGKRDTIATFTGSTYQAWVGPYPNRSITASNRFNLDSAITDIKYIVLNCTNSDLPTELQFYGSYTAPFIDTVKAIKQTKLRNAFGINGFEWNFVNTSGNSAIIDPVKFNAIKSFTGFRQYQDWQQIEQAEGSFTFNPTRSGGWNYDIIYDSCKKDSIDMLVCMQNIPTWMENTYPSNQQSNDNSPVIYGNAYSDPDSYIEKARAAFQMAVRYGNNTNIDSSLIHINTTPRWTSDPVNVVKIGLGTLQYIECTNEADKWWKDRKGYLTPYEFAACLSAFYDGNKNTMGTGVGVKNADSTMKVIMGGIASRNPSYIRGMIEWCRQNRGYKSDGKINLCWDVINYHHYSNNGSSSESNDATSGMAPEKSDAGATAAAFVKLAHTYAYDMPVWVTEAGFDQNQGSPQKAIPIGNKTVAETQADWILRTSLMYMREGIEKVFFYQLYDANGNSSVQYASMGLIDSLGKRKPAADYLYQVNNLLGQYVYTQTLNNDPVVDEYTLNNNPTFILLIPDETGRTSAYSLNVGNYDSVIVYTPQEGSDTMSSFKIATNNNTVLITVSETPQFVVPFSAKVYYTGTDDPFMKVSQVTFKKQFSAMRYH